MKKLFKSPVYWVIVIAVIGVIVARIIQVKNKLKAANADTKFSTGDVAKAFFTAPIYTFNDSVVAESKSALFNSGQIKPLPPIGAIPYVTEMVQL